MTPTTPHAIHHQPKPPPRPLDTDVTLTPDTIALLEDRISHAVAAGIQSAMTEDAARQFWGAGFRELQEEAQAHTGRFVLGGLIGLIKKLITFVALGGIVYAIGGWTLLGKLWHALFGTGA